jgi:hypothetical protein
MKILFTGMASSHCAPKDNVSFFGTLAKAVGEFAEVVWAAPKVSWTKSQLEEFDFIFLGFIPPTALSANKIYGAMHVLGLMFDSPKLRLVVDGQQIWQYKNSIEHVKRDISNLFDAFYSKRAEYSFAKDSKNSAQIKLAARHFSESVWPITYYPSLPWTRHSAAVKALGFSSSERFIGLNLDSLLLDPEPYDTSDKALFWSLVPQGGSWIKRVNPLIKYPLTSIKTSRVMLDSDVFRVVKDSLGLIVPPQDRGMGTWWSYRYIQALNSNTPVITDWVDTKNFHSSWAHLAYQIEDMSESEKTLVARDQLESYRSAIKTKNQAISSLRESILDLSLERI